MARKSRFDTVKETLNINSNKIIFLCGIYTRLSVEDGDDEEQNSLGNQKKLAIKYIDENSEMKFVDFYTDNGYTGFNYNRPGFKRMMDDLHSNRINCVIVKDISRLGRNFLLTSELAEKTFPNMNVRLISINDGYDSADRNSDASLLTLPLKMIMNDYYIRDISRKIRSSINTKINNGEFLPSSGSVPYGYLRNSDKNTFDVDTETAPVVKSIFEMKAGGFSTNAICKTLNEKGVPSPGKLRYIRGITVNPKYENALWVRKTVRKILSDTVYLGHRIHGKVKRDKVGLPKESRPECEWKIIYNAHPAIISEDLFKHVRTIAAKEKTYRDNLKKRADIEFDSRPILRDKLFCAECGSRMIGQKGCARLNANTFSSVFFNCGDYIESQHLLCSNHHINQTIILDSLKNFLDRQVQIAVDMEKFITEAKRRPELISHVSEREKKQAELRCKRRNIEAKTEQILVDLTEHIINRDEYSFLKERYSRQYEALLQEEEYLNIECKGLQNAFDTSQKWIQALKKQQMLPEINREIVEILVDKILVKSNREIKIILNYADPYKSLMDYLKEIGVNKDAV